MKKVFLFGFALAVLAACNSKESGNTTGGDSPVTPAAEIKSPYEIGYSSKFTMGDPRNAESVLALWKSWEGGDLSTSKDLFADSVEIYLADGSKIAGPRDSVLAGAQQFRSSLSSSVPSVDVIFAARSTDKNEEWALVWGKEVNTSKDGKVDSVYLHEAWRFNKDGKTDRMFQYAVPGTPPQN